MTPDNTPDDLITDDDIQTFKFARRLGYRTALADAQALIAAIRAGDPEAIAEELARFETKARKFS
jgi:hypothetical protein